MTLTRRWATTILALFCGAAHADESPKLETSGYAEAGVSYGVDAVRAQPALTGSQWIVDNVLLKMRYRPAPVLRLVFDNAVALGAPSLSPTHSYTNTSNYYSTKAQIRLGGPAAAGAASASSRLVLANVGAHMELGDPEGLVLAIGHLRVPFGMESTIDRLDMPTYYYSNSYTAAQVFGWHYDFGVRATSRALLPGALEVAIVEGRHPGAVHSDGRDVSSPALAFRWSLSHEAIGASLRSAASGYLGRFRGRPGDIGFTLGSYAKWERFRLNFEYLFTSTMTSYTSDPLTARAVPGTEYIGDTTAVPRSLDILGKAQPGHRAQAWSVYLEPGFALTPFWEISAKAEYGNHEYSFAKEDMNVAVGLTHRISEVLQARIVYQHFNLLGNLASHAHDVRGLVGTRF